MSGELVDIDVLEGDRGLHSNRVLRRTPQPLTKGNVKSYDPVKGWGFVTMPGSVDACFHKGDFAFPWVPVIGVGVTFYVGSSKGKPRACWVNPSEERSKNV